MRASGGEGRGDIRSSPRCGTTGPSVSAPLELLKKPKKALELDTRGVKSTGFNSRTAMTVILTVFKSVYHITL